MDVKKLKVDFLQMYDDSLNHEDFGSTLRLCRSDAAFLGPNGMVSGTDAIIELIKTQRAAFDDFKYEVEYIFASEEGVGLTNITRGRHMRPLFGIPGSGKYVEIRGMSIHKIVDGRSTGGWTCSKFVDILRAAYEDARAEGTLPS